MPGIHPTAIIDAGAQIGADTMIWHWVHVVAGARIGERCSIGQGCYVGNVQIGNGCRIQNHVSIYDGVTLEDDVFLGPACVFTNVAHPRAHVSRKAELAGTRVGRGATIGANATIVCGVAIGPYALVGAGAVVTRDVEPHAIVVGSPATRIGWACRCGETLPRAPHVVPSPDVRAGAPGSAAPIACARCGDVYAEQPGAVVLVNAGRSA